MTGRGARSVQGRSGHVPTTLVALRAGAEDVDAEAHAAPEPPQHDVALGKGTPQQDGVSAGPSCIFARASLHSSRREVRCCTTPSSSLTLKSLYTTSLCWRSISACTAFVTAAASTASLFGMDICCDQARPRKIVEDGPAGLRTFGRRLQHPQAYIYICEDFFKPATDAMNRTQNNSGQKPLRMNGFRRAYIYIPPPVLQPSSKSASSVDQDAFFCGIGWVDVARHGCRQRRADD